MDSEETNKVKFEDTQYGQKVAVLLEQYQETLVSIFKRWPAMSGSDASILARHTQLCCELEMLSEALYGIDSNGIDSNVIDSNMHNINNAFRK